MVKPAMLTHVRLFWVSSCGVRASTWLARVGIGGLPRGAQGTRFVGNRDMLVWEIGRRWHHEGKTRFAYELINVRVTTDFKRL